MATDGEAYWYKQGKIIKVQNSLHIKDVIDHPEEFNLTKKYIEDTYKKYNEKIYTEGKAREEIMVEVMKKGWVRVRQSTSRAGTRWIFQFADYKKQRKDLKNLVELLMLDKKEMKPYDDLYLLSYDGKTDEHYNDFIGRGIKTFLESLKDEKKIVIEQVNKYSYFNY
jgi:hypothetical protein